MMRSVLTALQVVMQSSSSTASTTPQRVAYLPEEHTDFIWSVQDERFYVVLLAIVVVLLFVLMSILKRRRSHKP